MAGYLSEVDVVISNTTIHRVVITGVGLINPVGNTVEAFWDSIRNGRHGFGPITRFDAEGYKAFIVAEVKDFLAERYMEKKDVKRLDLYSQYAVAAAERAFADSGMARGVIDGNGRAGVYFGTGIGGLITIQEQVAKLKDKGPERVNPLFIPMTITNMAAGHIAIRFGIKGESLSIVTACASSAHSIGEAFRAIRHGYQDMVIAGGSEAAITEIGVAGFINLTALTDSKDPDRACMPFDRDRGGFVMGEGACAVVLERLDMALARDARIYAELIGYGATSDAYHMTAPLADGGGAAQAMRLAIADAEACPADIGYINAHGTGTQANDLPETLAVKSVFGEMAYDIPVSSTKSMTGHLLGAAGATEAVVCALALRDGFIPPTIGLYNPGDGCDLDYVPWKGREADIRYAISNSLGFGGHNACLCLRKWEGR